MWAQSSLGPPLPIKLTLKGWTGLLVGPQLVDVRAERARGKCIAEERTPKGEGAQDLKDVKKKTTWRVSQKLGETRC